ncbi:hypothetical protein C4J81_02775 [Deltaproteobacteria bacterium Smac51]|nr:hypothetical protein C4J81_02775 [Deltaproteobacteria bacterium Smac51]
MKNVNHRNIKGAAGFTLIEVLVAVVVIALGCLAVLAFHASAVRSGSQADSLTAASFLAESQAELLRSLEFDSIEISAQQMENDPVCFSGSNDPCSSGKFNACYNECLTREGVECTGDNRDGCFKRTTALISGTPTSRSHTVTVTVQWRGPAKDHSMVYDSIISALGFGGN